MLNVPNESDIESLEQFRFTIAYTMFVSQDNNESIEELSIAQNISYQKINHFLSYYVDHAMWYDVNGQDMIDKHLTQCRNLLLITPIVNVTYLGNCLFKKFNTLCKPNVYVDGVSILDHSTGLSYVYRTDEPDAEIEILPDSKEWPGEFSIYDTPWWERDSISAYDYSCKSQEELDNIKFQIEEGEIEHEDWKIIEDEVIKQLSNDPNFNQENGKVIKFDFKKANNPKKVD
jgi:hypothetical protein